MITLRRFRFSLPAYRCGIITVWLACALVAMIGFMALGMDVGQILVTKQQLQRACDASALATATGYDDIYSPALSFYMDNALPGVTTRPTSGGHTYTVGNDTLTVTTPYGDAQTQAFGYASDDCIEIVATRSVRSLFGALSGAPVRTVRARAVAWRHLVAGGLPAIFAHRQGPTPIGFRWTGSGGETRGDIITNGSVEFTGTNHVCHGDVLYGYGYVLNGNGNYADHWRKTPAVRDWPIDRPVLSVNDFAPFDYTIVGSYKLTGSNNTIPPGVYYVQGDVSISASTTIAAGVTFVATGKIKVSGSGSSYTAARNGVLFYSTSTDGPLAVDISGSNSTFRGSIFSAGKVSLSGSGTTVTTDRSDVLIYSSLVTGANAIDISGSGGTFVGTCFAPGGGIDYSGSGSHIMNGSLIADHVDSTGTGFTVIPQATGSYAHMTAKLVE